MSADHLNYSRVVDNAAVLGPLLPAVLYICRLGCTVQPQPYTPKMGYTRPFAVDLIPMPSLLDKGVKPVGRDRANSAVRRSPAYPRYRR